MRVVSLVPSITETLRAWGVEPIAVTRFCEVPGLRTVGGTKNPDVEAIVALRPDVVLMDEEENTKRDHDALVSAGVNVVATGVRSVADVEVALTVMAEAVGHVRAVPLFEPMADSRRFRVFVPIWRRPWMTVGRQTYATSLLAMAGMANVFGEDERPYPEIDLAGVSADVVLAPSEPYKFTERHRLELEVVAPVLFVDGRDLFWWGTRTVPAMARLRELAARAPAG